MKATVLHDVYRWVDEKFDEVRTAFKGDEVDVSDDEFKRGSTSEPAGLAKAGSKDAKAAVADAADEDVAATGSSSNPA